MIVRDLLGSGRFEIKTTQHLLVECAINSARNDQDVEVVRKWFDTRKFSGLDGKVIEGIEISTKHLQSIVKRVYSSFSIDEDKKKEYLQKLEEVD